jgi:hypothetical protein
MVGADIDGEVREGSTFAGEERSLRRSRCYVRFGRDPTASIVRLEGDSGRLAKIRFRGAGAMSGIGAIRQSDTMARRETEGDPIGL